MTQDRADFSIIVSDNESAAKAAFDRGDFLQSFLLIHALTDALLRSFLQIPNDRQMTFDKLIKSYQLFLEDQKYPKAQFVSELTSFNRRRNRITHELWAKGYSATNLQAEQAASVAITVYSLFIEWLSTFDAEVSQSGFDYDDA